MTIIKASGEKEEKKLSGSQIPNIPSEEINQLSLKTSPLGQNGKSIEKLMPLIDKKTVSEEKKKNTGPEFSEFSYKPKEKNSVHKSEQLTKSVNPPNAENVQDDEAIIDRWKNKLNIASLRKLPEKIHFRKKNAIVIGALALICGALVLNHTLTGDNRSYNDYTDASGDPAVDTGTANVNADNENLAGNVNITESEYFSTAAVNRRRARDESLEVLQLVIDSEDALQESKDSALQSMSKIASQIEQESNIESLIKAKGFEDCIAVVGDGGATVIVASDGLLAGEVAQITEIICEQTSLPATGIKIVEKTPS
ncbi:MAG: SpoIIIAH-like family protein [Clostridia bacterium]|nr:SpoIIIAH-like family protein [Clostridia bacterium]